jgi:hypothetical protein
MSADQKPWAFIAHKDGRWAGITSADVPKKDLRKFIGDFVADGFAITTVYNQDEYHATIAKMKPKRGDR